ncbi:MAG: hypothetical protein AAB539_01935 [Patescibacteria group bacterium]
MIHTLQFDLDETQFKDLNEICQELKFPDRMTLFIQAVRFLWRVDRQIKNGKILLLKKDGLAEQVVFPFWDNIDQSSK